MLDALLKLERIADFSNETSPENSVDATISERDKSSSQEDTMSSPPRNPPSVAMDTDTPNDHPMTEATEEPISDVVRVSESPFLNDDSMNYSSV